MLILIPVEDSEAAVNRGQPIQLRQHKANDLILVSGLDDTHTVGMGLPVSAKAIRT